MQRIFDNDRTLIDELRRVAFRLLEIVASNPDSRWPTPHGRENTRLAALDMQRQCEADEVRRNRFRG
jgi:hypothetical protein